ncbi:hypothetical protein FACS1894133_5940 [Clostridia bacterium]|nr:hypothetical protein FACS1894133_5940 [Clostridia bacterium]
MKNLKTVDMILLFGVCLTLALSTLALLGYTWSIGTAIYDSTGAEVRVLCVILSALVGAYLLLQGCNIFLSPQFKRNVTGNVA